MPFPGILAKVLQQQLQGDKTSYALGFSGAAETLLARLKLRVGMCAATQSGNKLLQANLYNKVADRASYRGYYM